MQFNKGRSQRIRVVTKRHKPTISMALHAKHSAAASRSHSKNGAKTKTVQVSHTQVHTRQAVCSLYVQHCIQRGQLQPYV